MSLSKREQPRNFDARCGRQQIAIGRDRSAG
jgi:hypothetical protein